MPATTTLKEAKLVDFTKTVSGFKYFPGFNSNVVSFIRDGADARTLIVVDRGFHFEKEAPHLVIDHLNLVGTNPLVGANDPVGERFPSVNNIYITDVLPELPRAVAAGVKAGTFPAAEEMELVRSLGGQVACYNLVPTMIIAAHAGYRVLGLVAPEGADLSALVATVLG